MACEGDTTNVCAGTTDNSGCIVPKTYNAAIVSLDGVIVTSNSPTEVSAIWNDDISYPSEVVRIYFKYIARSVMDLTNFVSRDDGGFGFGNSALIVGSKVRLTLRPETETEYGHAITGTFILGETTDWPLVEEVVFHDGEVIIHSGQTVFL